MFQPVRVLARVLPERFRAGVKRRAAGIAFALLIEGFLALILLTLVPSVSEKMVPMVVMRLDQVREDEPAEEPEEPRKAPQPEAQPEQTARPVDPPPVPIEIPVIQLSREDMAITDIAKLPPPPSAPAPPRPVMGPPAPPTTGGDTPLVDGTGPNGEPLYAAAWYREPYQDELSGYLSTARGPGWGLIACRTVADYRVEDCVAIGEYPQGSNIARSVLAAAWQFRVRPPRVGGRVMVGEWVRIRIDYDLRQRPARY
ncbi:hypothetical protein [Sphingosinicella soli]|uniref:Protein TonB n=1 Tax=Sphingosinicella soli TaxID=333708 RepID=A0A7W7F6V5_9SPHN|nr:hypothetical protein [Sphingosinicella soli]MBB4632960.1 protein TonB [Sphingosinicella soli]